MPENSVVKLAVSCADNNDWTAITQNQPMKDPNSTRLAAVLAVASLAVSAWQSGAASLGTPGGNLLDGCIDPSNAGEYSAFQV
jgi:hypothetical protein